MFAASSPTATVLPSVRLEARSVHTPGFSLTHLLAFNSHFPFPALTSHFPVLHSFPFPAVYFGWHVAETDHAVYALGFSGYDTFETHSCHSYSVLCCLFMPCSLPFGDASTSVGALQLPKCLWGPSLLSDYEGTFAPSLLARGCFYLSWENSWQSIAG